jgi:GDP-4-dehydro-6-deoxy-D-mannose reductase
MAKRVLVTGSRGFTGRWFCRYMAASHPDWQVVGVDREPALEGRDPAMQVAADLRDAAAVEDLMASTSPAIVVHLAGLMRSAVAAELYEVNVLGTLNVLEAAARCPVEARPRVLVVGSAAEYGTAEASGDSIVEDVALRPVTHYGASKAAAETLALAYALRGDVAVVAARTFNLIGPGQPEGFLCADIVSRLRRIARREGEPILQMGNLSPVRDFVDVRDAVRAYWLLAQSGVSGQAYNVGSGIGVTVREMAETLVGLSGHAVELGSDESLRRAGDAARVVADIGRIRRDTGWQTEIALAATLRDMLDASQPKGDS